MTQSDYTTMFRYIIPFSYDEKYTDVCQNIDNITQNEDHIFCRITNKDHDEEKEYDTYEYIKNEFVSEENDDDSLPAMGCSWAMNGISKQPVKFRYFGAKDSTLSFYTECEIRKAGLFLFTTGLGFFWYQIDFPKNWNRTKDELVLFQNQIKELNHTDMVNLWKCVPKNITTQQIAEVPIPNSTHTTNMAPFFISQWIDEKIAFINPHYLPDRKCAWKQMHSNMFERLDPSINTNGKTTYTIEDDKRVPDRAIMFSYCSIEKESHIGTQLTSPYVYWLTNGYKQSYLYTADIEEEMLRPFENVYWYATTEGCLYYAQPTSINALFFKDFASKYCGDYFLLYIKVLFQSYSLLLFANKIQHEVSSNFAENDLKKVTDLTKEINIFLTKCMATSVSHIHHQNMFYNYLKKQLDIPNDVQDVTAGVATLEECLRIITQEQEQKAKDSQDKKMNILLAIVSLGGLFQCMSCTDAFWKVFTEAEPFVSIARIVTTGLIAIGMIVAIIVINRWIKDK